MSWMTSIVPSAQRVDLEERALLYEQLPVREQILAVDADPGTHLRRIVAVKFTGQHLACGDVKGSLLLRMPGMQVRLFVTLALFGTHRYEYAVEQ